MSIVYGVGPFIGGLFSAERQVKLALIFILYIGIALVSEVIQKRIHLKVLSNKTRELLVGFQSRFSAHR